MIEPAMILILSKFLEAIDSKLYFIIKFNKPAKTDSSLFKAFLQISIPNPTSHIISSNQHIAASAPHPFTRCKLPLIPISREERQAFMNVYVEVSKYSYSNFVIISRVERQILGHEKTNRRVIIIRTPEKTGYFQKSETSTICVGSFSLVPPITCTKFELNIV